MNRSSEKKRICVYCGSSKPGMKWSPLRKGGKSHKAQEDKKLEDGSKSDSGPEFEDGEFEDHTYEIDKDVSSQEQSKFRNLQEDINSRIFGNGSNY
ncbi:hypothetical protein CAEBREN_05604 [Caenorhabditis brenneri]|uniref:Uncharacterized protein n=1 Tax=Caenorhabditis brenneri TaxID=135651 RepID=G0NVZ2_CAEBE|nr:hypothetical protein CAEBREN_05604 [Caenorhabditis brenneri]